MTAVAAVAALATMTVAMNGLHTAPMAAATSPGDVVTLTVGTDDPEDRPMAVPIDEFARQVDELSGGAMRIEPVWRAAGGGIRDWDQAVARMVVSGELDMGVIPARAWDTEGVTTLRALLAPFLVDSEALAAAIATDEELSRELLAGLNDVGITGLALLPESLRHVFSFGEPLLSPDDFAGTTIRVPHSETTYAFFEALGAIADDPNGDAFAEAAATGELAGAESSFDLALGLPGVQILATGNVTPFAKLNSLVINTEVFDGLSAEQQAVLVEAAVLTRDAIVAGTVDDATAAEEFCAGGGRIVLATDADLAAFAEATQSVYDELNQDAATAALIDRIDELKAQTPSPPAVEACGTAATPVDDLLPEGIYRTREVTRDELIATGVAAGFDAEEVEAFLNEVGVGYLEIGLRLADGGWTTTVAFDGGPDEVAARGPYEVIDADTMIAPGDCGQPITLRYAIDGDSVTFDVIDDECVGISRLVNALNFETAPFVRVTEDVADTMRGIAALARASTSSASHSSRHR